MRQKPIRDVSLLCSTCDQKFIFSAGEQELLELRGVRMTPERCPRCRRLAPRREPHYSNPAS